MEKFTTLISGCVPLPLQNIDTDQIIPARFLKTTTRKGFGDNLFRDWRYDKEGKPNSDFILNTQPSGKIFVVGKNFACGSSREHAAWAIYDYGFRVVISSFFADIFKNNALNTGLLPIQTSQEFMTLLFKKIEEDPEVQMKVSLEDNEVVVMETDLKAKIDISPYKKYCLTHGYDDIDFLLSKREEIEKFEKHTYA